MIFMTEMNSDAAGIFSPTIGKAYTFLKDDRVFFVEYLCSLSSACLYYNDGEKKGN